jgi:hypothetical protein
VLTSYLRGSLDCSKVAEQTMLRVRTWMDAFGLSEVPRRKDKCITMSMSEMMMMCGGNEI